MDGAVRQLTVWMQMSLDGYSAAPGPFDWPVVTEDLTDFWLETQQQLDTFVYGRKIFGFMSAFRPTADADRNAGSYQKAYAPIWRETPKVVISNTLESVEWNTTVIGGDVSLYSSLPLADPDEIGPLDVRRRDRLGAASSTNGRSGRLCRAATTAGLAHGLH
jgi:dihydrofolate reductase